MRSLLILIAVVAMGLLSGCVGTLALRQNINTEILSGIDQKSSVSAVYSQMVDIPDTIKLTYLATDSGAYNSTSKYLHNIKPTFQGMFAEYMTTKFNTMKKTADTLKVSVSLKDYKVSSRDISAKGQKFFAMMVGVADLRNEYSAEINCIAKIEYKGEIYQKDFLVKENDQNLTQLRSNTISAYNTKTGYTSASYSTSSSSNPEQDGIGNCLNNAHTKVILNLDKMINDILSETKATDNAINSTSLTSPQIVQPKEKADQQTGVDTPTVEEKNIE